jgi:hypothetical protein
MAECLAQLAACILPPVALPISLPIALFVTTIGGVMEAMKIWSGCSKLVLSTAKLVGTPSSMETAPVATKISKGLALREKG